MEKVKEWLSDNGYGSGIGGDDRCGVYMILQILKKHKCHVLFTEDEESGCVGTQLFLKTDLAAALKDKFQFVIELDRKGNKDAVFYDCDNPDFTSFITKEYWEKAYGSFTDISYLCPALGCAGVNFSCGYYNPHTVSEYVNLTEMENSIKEVCKLLDRTTEADKYEYIECEWSYNGYDYRNYYYDEGYDDYYYDYSHKNNRNRDSKLKSKYNTFGGGGYDYEICYLHQEFQTLMTENIQAWSEEEAVGKFLINNPNYCFYDIYCVTDVEKDFYPDFSSGVNSKLPSAKVNTALTVTADKNDQVPDTTPEDEDEDKKFNEYLASMHGYAAE